MLCFETKRFLVQVPVVVGAEIENNKNTVWIPAIDIFSTDDEFLIISDLPGVNKKDLTVRIDGTLLAIEGERLKHKHQKNHHVVHKEREHGFFSRKFVLPEPVEAELVKATISSHGLLTVVVPKKDRSQHMKYRGTNINVTVDPTNVHGHDEGNHANHAHKKS